MPFFLLSDFGTKQARISLKFYEWKGVIPSEYQKKKKTKIIDLSIEPPTAKSCLGVSGQFFYSGSHIILDGLR